MDDACSDDKMFDKKFPRYSSLQNHILAAKNFVMLPRAALGGRVGAAPDSPRGETAPSLTDCHCQ